MRIIGIIAEYNPFHNGHLYQINRAKKELNADYVVAIMSGNFVQRGEPAIIDKFERTKILVDSGVDLVIELPTIFSISSAEGFAYGAVKILDELNIIDYLVFGIEEENILELKKIAELLELENSDYKDSLKNELKKGVTYSKAIENVISKYGDFSKIIKKPNNILGIEYLRAIKKLDSNIIPYGITRNSVGHNDIEEKDEFASASLIRKKLLNNENINKFVPEKTVEILSKNKLVSGLEEFSDILFYKIRMMSKEDIANINGVSEGLENLIKKAAETTNNFNELISIIKSKRYTRTRINRILVSILLDIRKNLNFENIIPRVLGVSKNGIGILKKIDNIKTNYKGTNLTEIEKIDIKSTQIYTIKSHKKMSNLDFTQKFIKGN